MLRPVFKRQLGLCLPNATHPTARLLPNSRTSHTIHTSHTVQTLGGSRISRGFSDKREMRELTALKEFNDFRSGKTVFVDFYADWCPPCRMIAPKFAELAQKYSSDLVQFVKVNVDSAQDIARQEGISAMPTFKAYRGSQLLGELLGANPSGLEALIKDNLPK